MKKGLKVILIILGVLVGFVLIDSIQALVFNNKPIIGLETKCMRKEGILVNTYYCDTGKITKLRFSNSSCDTTTICGIEEFNNQVDIENVIKENFKKMLEVSSGISSSTYDYIQNEYYDNIINLGSGAVPVLLKMYENGEFSKNGLDANISVIAIQEIAKCNIKDKYGVEWTKPEEFYELWKNYNCGMNQNSNDNYIIVDNSLEIDGFTCDTALDPFYEDEEYSYSFSCIKSDYVVVRYEDGHEETVKDALKNNKIRIEDLDKYNIKYYKEKK